MIKMDVQDYEYYEARAKDVKLEDITSSQQNADILARLRGNDPRFTNIYIAETVEDGGDFIVREGDDLGWLGYFVGRNKQVKVLCIENFPEHLNIDAFLKGLGHNRSIQCLHISLNLGDHFQSFGPFLQNNNNLRDLTFDNSVELDCAHNNLNMDAFFDGLGHNQSIQNLGISTDIGEDFKSLGPFLRNNNSLSHLTFSCFDIGLQCARNIASLLGLRSSLKSLNFGSTDLGDEELVEIASALRIQPQIEELNLSGNDIGRDGCVALGSILEGMRNPNLAALDLGYNDIDDEGLHALVAGLINCHKLTSLNLNGNALITGAGLRSLSTLLRSDHCRLECLHLYQMNMDNDGVTVLAAGLASLSTLKKLNLSNNRISDQGLQDLVGSLVNCNIENLYLSHNSFSVFGLRSLGALMQRTTRLTSLWLGRNAINDEGLECLVEGIVNCCSLQTLDLSNNQSITAAGLTSLSTFFRSDNCCLEKLWLWGINFGDDGAVALADGLMGNNSLTHVNFDSRGITSRGWSAFSKLLCDTASVNNTYLSNHTLVEIGGYRNVGNPSTIVEYLKFNKLQNCTAAICKILDSHPDIDIEPLFQWKLKCLPLVVRWLENARSYLGNVNQSTEVFQCRQLSALYKFVHGMPQLAVDGYRGKKMKDIQSMSKKRKLDETL